MNAEKPPQPEFNARPQGRQGNQPFRIFAPLRFCIETRAAPSAKSVLLLLSLLLAACAPSFGTSLPSTPATETLPATAIPTDTLPIEPSATPEILPLSPDATPTPATVLLPAPPSTQTVEAMQLFFPTVIPVEGAEYRPPIYPVPWALSPYDHFYFTRPLSATYPADPQTDYLYGGTFFGPEVVHSGIDMPAPYGADVLAAGPGTVVWAGYGLFSGTLNNTADPYGLAVAIRHDFGYQNEPLFTIYAHMSDVVVIPGQWVNTGDVVGKVGSTGHSTGPHVHFEVRLGANDFFHTRNPELWIAPPQGYGVLVGRVMRTYNELLLDSYPAIVTSLATGQKWEIKTYAGQVVNPDPYYRENITLGGLPAGVYQLYIPYPDALPNIVYTNFEILPGQVTFFTFSGYYSFDFSPPAAPTP